MMSSPIPKVSVLLRLLLAREFHVSSAFRFSILTMKQEQLFFYNRHPTITIRYIVSRPRQQELS